MTCPRASCSAIPCMLLLFPRPPCHVSGSPSSQAKERKFGPNHEEVAEACSNPAILYNQNGDYKRALPLYERALRIWEKTKGPECADVAHTLTGAWTPAHHAPERAWRRARVDWISCQLYV